MDIFVDRWDEFWVGCARSLEIMLGAGVLALVLGTVLAALRVGPVATGRAVGATYVYVVRNTPLLVIMFIAAFGVPNLDVQPEFSIGDHELLSFDFNLIMATASLGCYTAAFVCEAIRSGINAVPIGQAEAARAVGMTFSQTLSLVVLPQALRVVIPPLASVMIAMVKNSSVALAIGVTEAAYVMGKWLNDEPGKLWPIFIGFALFYMAVVALISLVSGLLERKYRVAS